jgi:hypothetical protein
MLAEDGYVEDQTAARLRQMVGVRDAVVHGDLSIDVPRDQVRWLLETLRAIVAEMEAAQVLDKTAFVPGDQRPIYAEHKGHDSPDTVGAGLAVAEG